ncbi:MAG: two-component sensor histidine kinase [Candidatus Nanopelagicales bacterium]|nr:two-component sensor histidine kinase [Candidatus Nanopelagicales bacterium]
MAGQRVTSGVGAPRLVAVSQRDSTAGVPDEILRVLSVLPSASLVVDADGTVLLASARSLGLGLVSRNSVAIPDISHLIERVLEDGIGREQEMRVRRPPLGRELLELRVRVAALGTGSVVVLIDDLAEERKVDAVRRDFVANVSHELKTPVGALALLAEAVQSASDDAVQVRHFAERMQIEAGRLGNLIQDVIDLSRLQGDDPLTHAQVIDIDELVNRAIDEVRTIATSSDTEFIQSVDSGGAVYGDLSQIQTAVRNLLANAISYSPGSTKVAVDTRVVGGLVEIVVKDQGIGIPSHELDRVFERFYRVDPARSRLTGGTGLGLAIVKHVCQNHGGECTVWSEVGVGSSFTLRLPAYAGQESGITDGFAWDSIPIHEQEVLS